MDRANCVSRIVGSGVIFFGGGGEGVEGGETSNLNKLAIELDSD